VELKIPDEETYKNCLHDIICILKDTAFDEKKDVEKFKLKGKKLEIRYMNTLKDVLSHILKY
jgi:hypothetical protein